MTLSRSWLLRIVSVAAVLCALGTVAFAGGRTFNLDTLAKRGTIKLRPGEQTVTVRAPKSVRLNQTFGPAFRPVAGKANKAGTATLYRVTRGTYETRRTPVLRFAVFPSD